MFYRISNIIVEVQIFFMLIFPDFNSKLFKLMFKSNVINVIIFFIFKSTKNSDTKFAIRNLAEKQTFF